MMKSRSGVYLIKIGPNNFYYGSSSNLHIRKSGHLCALKRGKHNNKKMQQAWDFYQDFSFEIVEFCPPSKILKIEQKYINGSIDNPFSMNISSKAIPGFHSQHSAETKKKISNSLKGRQFSQEHRDKLRYKRSDKTRKKMSISAKNRSAETIKKIRKTLTGHSVSLETREKISKSLQGRKQSNQHRKNISKGLNRHYSRKGV